MCMKRPNYAAKTILSQAFIYINGWSLYPVSTVMFSVKTITRILSGVGGGRLPILYADKTQKWINSKYLSFERIVQML